MGDDKKEPLMVMTPSYNGPERRKEVEVVVKKCFCHMAHATKLEEHDQGLEKNSADHKLMWDGIKDKVSNKLFYLFVVIVIGGLGVVYTGIHKVDKTIAIVETKVEANMSTIRLDINRLEQQIRDHDRKDQNHYKQHSSRGESK